MVKWMLPLLALVAPLLVGCQGGSEEAASIPECEQYFRRAKACFSKNPVAKASMSDSVDQVREMMTPKGGQPLERPKLVDLCKQRTAALTQGGCGE